MQYWINNTKNILTLFVIVILFNYHLQAQENSPYSRYALGNIKQTENVANRAMGGVSIADDNSLISNPTNPATYTGLRMTCYQFSIEGSAVTIKNSYSSNRTGTASLSYVNIGFPVSKKMGVSFGLMPQTRAYYQMQEVKNINAISQVTNSYYGGGGMQRIYVGAGYKVKNLSLGFNTGYNFGNIKQTSETQFTDSLNILSSYTTNRTTLGGLFWQIGAIYNQKIKKDYSINIAATYTGREKINGKNDKYVGSFFGELGSSTNPYQFVIDSVMETKGKIKVPGLLGTGLLFKNGDYWQVGIDYTASNWANFTTFGNNDSTANSWYLKVGGAITPDANSVTSTLKRMTYRAGAYHGNDIFSFKGNTLSKTGFTVGISYPLRRTNLSIGQINLSLDFGKRGSTNNGMIKESYSRFGIGLTLNDRWFIKRKYE